MSMPWAARNAGNIIAAMAGMVVRIGLTVPPYAEKTVRAAIKILRPTVTICNIRRICINDGLFHSAAGVEQLFAFIGGE